MSGYYKTIFVRTFLLRTALNSLLCACLSSKAQELTRVAAQLQACFSTGLTRFRCAFPLVFELAFHRCICIVVADSLKNELEQGCSESLRVQLHFRAKMRQSLHY